MSTCVIKPQALKKGDTVAIVAPSGIVRTQSLKRGISFLKSLGLEVKIDPLVMNRLGYLAGSDEERAESFMRSWTDPQVKAVIAARGGYGAMRILPYLDFDTIGQNPKILCGYSDITALHLALWKEIRLITFHGPVAEIWEPRMNEYDYKIFEQALFGCWPPGHLTLPQDCGEELVILESGRAKGRLVGGNLSLIVSTMGTPWEIDVKGNVLFLEEVGEKPYRVDRMLCQLKLSGKLADALGFCIGSFTNCDPDPERPAFTVSEILKQYFTGTGKPCIKNIPAGHGEFNATLPLGAKVEINALFESGDSVGIHFKENVLCKPVN